MNEALDKTPEYRRGWAAAIAAVSQWHAAKSKQAQVQARRARFPKQLENEAALLTRLADEVRILSPDDV
jgi:hypothetical protein